MKKSQSNIANTISASKKILLVSFLALAFLNCKNKENKAEETTIEESSEEIVNTAPVFETGCYMYNENGNMVNLEITKADNPVEGNLTYALAEKDKNTGTFKGEFNNYQLVGIYTFQSEGIESVRQVAFMLVDNQLIEGYGELNEDGTMFKDANAINYTSTMPLTKTDCNQ